MNYRITKGDLEIAKNVITQLSLEAYKKLERERDHFAYETDCPSYGLYHALVDALVCVEEKRV
jgi:tRNA splicing endonuclease